MTEKAVTPYTPGLPARQGEQPDDLDAFGQVPAEELVLPVRRLVQGVSRKADARMAGQFWDELANSYKPILKVAILALAKSRSYFEEGSLDQPPACVSDDAITPRQRIVTASSIETGPTCAECPLSQWASARDGKGRGQACRLSYNVLCFDLEEEAPFIFRVSGTSIGSWLRYLTANRLKRTPAYALATRIGSELRTFDAGQAYVAVFQFDDRLSASLTEAMRQQAAAYRGVSLGVEEEAVPDPSADEPLPYEVEPPPAAERSDAEVERLFAPDRTESLQSLQARTHDPRSAPGQRH